MREHIINSTTVPPVKLTYGADENLQINEKGITPQGLPLLLNDANYAPVDVSDNNYSLLTLTNKKYTKHLLRLQLPNTGDIYPYVFTTYMMFTNSALGYFNLTDAKANVKRWKYPGTDERIFYLTVEEIASDNTTTRNYAISNEEVFTPLVKYTDVPSTRLFHVELLSNKLCRVYHDDSFVKTCLTYPDLNDPAAVCTFTQFNENSNYTSLDPQVFNYSIDSSSGYMILSKDINSRTVWISQQGTLNGEALENTVLQGEDVIPGDGVTWLPKAMIRIRVDALKNISGSIARSVDTAWYRYNSGILEQNSVEIDDTYARIFDGSRNEYYINSYPYLQNNFLISSQYHNIVDNQLTINITPLKNQLTPEGDQPENNPHATGDIGEFCLDYVSRKNVDFRTYQKIYSGFNQNKGDDKIHLNYTAYTSKIVLKSDQVTYFHMPDVMKPFTWMNVNYRRVAEYPEVYPMPKLPVAAPKTYDYEFEDFVGLIRAGAIAGNSPMNSDKIFKKRANYRYYTPWGDAGRKGNKGEEGDSHFGTWLCSWLMAVPGSDKYEKKYGPVWMDRYYDDAKFSDVQIMSKEPNCFDSLVDALDTARDDVTNAKSYFDIPSQLKLERGVQYAYYHIGNKENKKIIDSISKFVEQEDVSTYTRSVSGEKQALAAIQDNGYNIYDFSGDKYTRTKAPYPAYGDFRVSMWLYSDDWTQPFGHQVFGNYVSNGLAVLNDQIVTPLLTFQDNDSIKITNTELDTLASISQDFYTDSQATPAQSDILICREEQLSDITVISSVTDYCTINTFDINGNPTLSYAITGQGVLGKQKIVSAVQKTVQFVSDGIDQSSTFLYTLHDGLSSVCRFSFAEETYIDLSPTMFEWCSVSGVDGGIIDGYDGIYTRNTDLPPQNGKPVYIKSTPSPLAMFYDGTRFRITEDVSTYTNGAFEVTANDGDIPTQFTTNTGRTALAQVDFTDDYPSPIHVGISEQDTSWSSVYAPAGVSDLYVVAGDMVCSSHQYNQNGTNKLYFVRDKSVYSHVMTFNQASRYNAGLVFDGSDISKINNIKVDSEEHLWIMYDDRYVARYTPLNEEVFRVDINNHVSTSSTKQFQNNLSFDIVSEYQQNASKQEYGLIVHQNVGVTNTDLITITPAGVVTIKNAKTAKVFNTPTLISNQKNFSNYDYNNRTYYKSNNTFTFKFKASNKYAANESVVINYDFPVYKLTPGWHHFCFGFDATNRGAGYFQIDGLFDDGTGSRENPGVVPLLSRRSYGKYGFTEMLSKTTSCGATQGYSDVLLCDYIKQPGYYFIKNMQMKSFRLYNFNLFRINVQSLAREHINIPDMQWSVPCGRRGHLDHVDKFHKHSLPIHKSADFETHIINSDFTDAELVEDVIKPIVKQTKPVYSQDVKYTQSDPMKKYDN